MGAMTIRSQYLNKLAGHLAFLYGEDRVAEIFPQLEQILEAHLAAVDAIPTHAGALTERDVMLITYPDQVHQPGIQPLQTLARFLKQHLQGLVTGVHLLPFFPYSSDEGFSVIDYRRVLPALGSWTDVAQISSEFRLMIDAVINHISSQSAWFQGFLDDSPPYANYFISLDPETDLSSVVRPRDLPLLTRVETKNGARYVWTTFSADQIDLNFANPKVLLEILDLLLFYIRHGAQFIRLDAIAFLWKTIGSSCIHLPQTHRIVQLIRTMVDAVAPWVYLITETNVPHEENLSYFGNGTNEAQLIYQFALPPLVLHTFLAGDASRLTAWASTLHSPTDRTTFFNFLASHDGIGLRPARGILTDQQIEKLVDWTESRRGKVSYRSVAGDQRLPYELNISYFDALAEPGEGDKPEERWIARFLASQAIVLSLIGVPGIYFHSLFGSQNDLASLQRTGQPRSINREKLALDVLEPALAQKGSLRAKVFAGYARLLRARRNHPAFSPAGDQQVLDINSSVFTLIRRAPNDGRRVLCLHEVAGHPTSLDIHLAEHPTARPYDLIAKEQISLAACTLAPYQIRWITLDDVEGK
jgi:glycosidase